MALIDRLARGLGDIGPAVRKLTPAARRARVPALGGRVGTSSSIPIHVKPPPRQTGRLKGQWSAPAPKNPYAGGRVFAGHPHSAPSVVRPRPAPARGIPRPGFTPGTTSRSYQDAYARLGIRERDFGALNARSAAALKAANLPTAKQARLMGAPPKSGTARKRLMMGAAGAAAVGVIASQNRSGTAVDPGSQSMSSYRAPIQSPMM